MTTTVALVLLGAIISYGVLGGANFGTGLWDLTAGGAARGASPELDRSRYRASVGGQPHLAHLLPRAALVRLSGGVRGDHDHAVHPSRHRRLPIASWLNPTSALGGVLAVLTCGYLAAVFLTAEAHRAGVADLEQWSRRRAVIAAAGAGAVAIVGLFVLHHDARRLFVHLLDRGWPLVAVSTIAGLAALLVIGFAPLRNRPAWARPLSALAVAAILAGWGVAQYPYLLGTH